MNFKSNRVWVYSEAVDMRKSYDGLYGLIRRLRDPLQGDVYLFISRNRKRVQALYWDGSGLNIWKKRLEQGRFADVWRRSEMSLSELGLFFEGSQSVTQRLTPEDLSASYTA
jgi:hypothetical protein